MKEKQFWNRLLELAHDKLTQSVYDFYILDAKLVKVEENTATIFLPRDEMQIFWERNINGMLLAAGFEIYDTEIKAHYIFTKVEEASSQVAFESEPGND